MKRFTFIFSFTLLLVTSGLQAQKKDDLKKDEITKLVADKRFVFKAQSMMPSLTAPNRQLTSDYDVKISPDTIICYLPYFGRAYQAPMDPSKGGIQFTSTKFEYQETKRKKGGWDIVIKPQDDKETRQINLTVSEAGYASVQVLSNNRQPISFNGYIVQRK
jgi:hypothetical protein